MIRHVVMFKFLENAEGRTKEENVRLTADMLNALQGVVPTLKASNVYIGAACADKSNCDLLLISDFDSFEDLQAYIVHPRHKAVGEFMRPLRESRACVDFEL